MSGKAYEYLLAQPWAIRPEMLDAGLAIALRENSPQAIEGRPGRKMDDTTGVTRRGDVAVVNIRGPIFAYADFFTELCGGVTTEALARDITSAYDDPSCSGIVLNIDSPGGEAACIGELASMIRGYCSDKPITGYVASDGCSAAYWIAAACSEVVMAPGAFVGSIGVVAAYPVKTDDPKKPRVDFVSSQSPDKRPDVLTEKGRAVVQTTVDDLAGVFVAAVADYRGVDAETVLSKFGKGGVLIGQKAVDAGMADRLGSLESVISEFQNRGRGVPTTRRMTGILTSRDLVMSKTNEPANVETVELIAKPLDISALPQFKQMSDKLAALEAQNKSLETRAKADRAERIEALASQFVQAETVAGRSLPAEAATLKGLFVTCASDDDAHPLATGSRCESLKAFAGSRPSHGMFAEQISVADLPANVIAFGQRPNSNAANPDAPPTDARIADLMKLVPEFAARIAK